MTSRRRCGGSTSSRPPISSEPSASWTSRSRARPAEERAHLLAVLRRYHNWLDSLPENVKDSLLAKPPEERMAQVKSLVLKYPSAAGEDPLLDAIRQRGGGHALRARGGLQGLAGVTPEQRRDVEKLATLAQRRERLFELGRELKIPREVRPADFYLEDWIPKVEAKILELRETDPELRGGIAKAALAKRRPPRPKASRTQGSGPVR